MRYKELLMCSGFPDVCWRYCMANEQKVIAGVKPMAQYEVPYDFVINGKKRSGTVIVQADSPDGAVLQAKTVLKGSGPVKIRTPKEWLSEVV